MPRPIASRPNDRASASCSVVTSPARRSTSRFSTRSTASSERRRSTTAWRFASGAPDGFAAASEAVVQALSRLSGGRATIVDGAVTVSGYTYYPAATDMIAEELKSGLPDGFKVAGRNRVAAGRSAGRRQPVPRPDAGRAQGGRHRVRRRQGGADRGQRGNPRPRFGGHRPLPGRRGRGGRAQRFRRLGGAQPRPDADAGRDRSSSIW